MAAKKATAKKANAWPQAAALWQTAADKCLDAERRAYYEKQAAWCRDMAKIAPETET